jgi:N-formylglutamate amidohydrolase
VFAACGTGDLTPPTHTAVTVFPPEAFLVGVGTTVDLVATVTGGGPVTWASADPAVATVDAGGRVTAVATGSTSVAARSGGDTATVAVEVWAPTPVEHYEIGTAYLGRSGYVEYVPGALPLVVAVPHGGALTPTEIPDRTSGTTVTDAATIETALAFRDALVQRTGKAPHLVISHLKRTKLDPNREIVEAAQGNPYAENAWNEFQAYIEVAEALVEDGHGSGLFLEIHGHGHAIDRVELGYLLSAATLDRTDEELDAAGAAALSSIRALAETSPLPFSRLLRGPESFGAFLGAVGVPSVPSPTEPTPGAAEYFTGGYDTDRHGSRWGGTISAVQMELHRTGIRDTEENRRTFGVALADAVERYMNAHWGFFAASSR